MLLSIVCRSWVPAAPVGTMTAVRRTLHGSTLAETDNRLLERLEARCGKESKVARRDQLNLPPVQNMLTGCAIAVNDSAEQLVSHSLYGGRCADLRLLTASSRIASLDGTAHRDRMPPTIIVALHSVQTPQLPTTSAT